MSRLTLKLTIGIFITIILILAFCPLLCKRRQMRLENEVLKEKIEQLKAENINLLQEKESLENDPVFLEREAREKLGITRENEVIYKVKGKRD